MASLREWAQKGEREHSFQDATHSTESEQGELWKRVVVPSERRKEILQIGHSSPTGGHFSRRIKTEGTWPGISKEMKSWCKSCPECQKAARAVNVRALLQPLPVISTPFSRLAFDLVGPLPRTKSGHKSLDMHLLG